MKKNVFVAARNVWTQEHKALFTEKLFVTALDDGKITIKFDAYHMEGEEVAIDHTYQASDLRGVFNADNGVKLFALVRVWDSFEIIEYTKGLNDGPFSSVLENHIATFIIGKDGSIGIVSHVPAHCENGKIEMMEDGSRSMWDRLIQMNPNFGIDQIREKTKAVVMTKLNAHASIAALESQVDILSKIVFDLIDELKAKPSPLAAEFRQTVEQTSILNIKGSAEVLQDIGLRKARVRELQERRDLIVEDAKQKFANRDKQKKEKEAEATNG